MLILSYSSPKAKVSFLRHFLSTGSSLAQVPSKKVKQNDKISDKLTNSSHVSVSNFIEIDVTLALEPIYDNCTRIRQRLK